MASIASWFTARLLVACTLIASLTSAALPAPVTQFAGTAGSYIVQSTSTEAAASTVVDAGGVVSRSLPIIDGVAATLSAAAAQRLHATHGIVLHSDIPVHTAGTVAHEAFDAAPPPAGAKETKTKNYYWLYPSAATGATLVHSQQITVPKRSCSSQRSNLLSGTEQRPLQGWGVTVAFVDSGFLGIKDPTKWVYRDAATGLMETEWGGRCMVYRDFVPRSDANGNTGTNANNSIDQNGHGTHVVGSVVDDRSVQLEPNGTPKPIGVAPQVNLMIARALGKDGSGSYSDVIAAIGWIVANKATYNVRVLNLSLYAPVTGPYWADPINQAVMKAWQSGLVVVAAAGNDGPTAGTITVPGNVPYVITAGAIKSGRYTTSSYDELATYSSRGPTESAFVKPDILVPASQTIAPIPKNGLLTSEIPDAQIKDKTSVKDATFGFIFADTTYYRLSGTSMATAQVSGLAALMLQANPNLTNDQVKYRMMATAMPAFDAATNQPVYTPWEQGAGMVDIQGAIASTLTDSANQGMDIATDLDPNSTTHYWGYTTWDATTNTFKLVDPTTGGQLAVWDGGNKVWGGGNKVWGGGNKVWGGGNKVWGGGNKVWGGGITSWAGSDSLWAGSNRVWAGSTPSTSLSTASHTEVLPDN